MNIKIVVFFSVLLSMSLLSCDTSSKPSKAVPPGAKIVELSIPILCEWPDKEYEVSFILESIDGVYKAFASGRSQSVKIWYDEKSANANAFIKILNGKEYYVSGEPKFLN